ncbi:MAG: YtxH domain-containing protein [Massilibacteroides sp.]|nr:YtxH domain-containing protein [Massilibacteroides sp.]
MKNEKTNLWIGVAIGVAAGLIVGFLSAAENRKKTLEEVKGMGNKLNDLGSKVSDVSSKVKNDVNTVVEHYKEKRRMFGSKDSVEDQEI